MKNKKLFAILTLVCFMFTLMPVAAFAVATPVDPADCVVKVLNSDNELAEDAVVTAGQNNVKVIVEVNEVAVTTDSFVYYVLDDEGKGVQMSYTLNGGYVPFTIKTAGDYTVYAIEKTEALKTLTDNANNISHELTVADAVARIQTQLDAKIVKACAYVTVEAPSTYFGVKVEATTDAGNVVGNDATAVEVKADNGFTSVGTVRINVATYADKALNTLVKNLSGQKVTIVAPDYVNVTPADAKKVTTNAQGDITYAISASKAGTFTVVFEYQNAEAEVKVIASPEGVATVETVEQPKAPVNNEPDRNNQVNTGVDFKFVDANGSAYKTLAGNSGSSDAKFGGIAKITVLSQPATSKLTGKADFALADGTTAGDGVYDLLVNTRTDLKVGSYEVKVSLANGNYATASFEVAEMGDVVGIRFVKAPASVEIGGVLAKADFAIQAYDAAGVTDNSVVWADLSANGKAIKDENAAKTLFNIEKEDKYVGSVITVLARYTTTSGDTFVATTDVNVVDKGMEVKYLNTEAEVGVNTTLVAKVLDASGNYTNVSIENVKFNVAGEGWADASALGAWDAVKKQLAVNFIASAAGEYKLETVIELTDGSYLYSVDTITVGNNEAAFDDVVVVSINADKIVVNSDVKEIPAPAVIKDMRTFVPLRAVAEAFGAIVDWDQATGAVTAELGGVKVVMMAGEKAYTVNGVAKTADVAPYLNVEASTTMVPVSFIAQAFGIDYQCIYAADGTVADVLFTK